MDFKHFTGRPSFTTPSHGVNYQAKDVVSGKTFLVCMGILFALVLAVAVLSCSICYHLLRRRLHKTKSRRTSAEIIDIPDPFATIQTKTSEGITYKGLDLVAQQLQLEPLPDLDPQDDLSEHRGLSHVKSYDDLLTCSESEEFQSTRWSKRSQSLASLNYDSLEPSISFSLNYTLSTSTLSVIVHELTRLPFKYRCRFVMVSVFLYPSDTEGASTEWSAYMGTASFEKQIQFSDVTTEDLEKSTLRFCVSARKMKSVKAKKGSFVGQVYLKGSDVIWMPPRLQQFAMKLERKQLNKNSTSEKYLYHGLGELFLLLQYQLSANRIKVLVLKARDLPRSDKLLGRPVHYVVIKLLKDGDLVEQRETSIQSGHNPTWNQPFLFDTPSVGMDLFSLEFVIMRDRRTNDSVVGHVTIGPEKSGAGNSHWEEIMNPYRREVSKWHHVMPVLKFE